MHHTEIGYDDGTMANWPPGTLVLLRPDVRPLLRFPPPPGASAAMLVAVHADALKAKDNLHTQLVALRNGVLDWVGALDEARLTRRETILPSPRGLLGSRLLRGRDLWSVIRPGPLAGPGEPLAGSTIYGGMHTGAEIHRPWIVIGELGNGQVLAVPLNEAADGYQRLPWFVP